MLKGKTAIKLFKRFPLLKGNFTDEITFKVGDMWIVNSFTVVSGEKIKINVSLKGGDENGRI